MTAAGAQEAAEIGASIGVVHARHCRVVAELRSKGLGMAIELRHACLDIAASLLQSQRIGTAKADVPRC